MLNIWIHEYLWIEPHQNEFGYIIILITRERCLGKKKLWERDRFGGGGGGRDIVLSKEKTECEGEMSGVEEMVAEGGTW